MNRRAFLTSTAAFAAALPAAGALQGKKMGIVIHSYWKRWQGKYSNLKYPPFGHALDVLDHVRDLGVGGLQTLVGGWTSEFAGKVRATCESYGMKLEGSITLPRNENDVGRFEKEVRIAKEAGAVIFRSATGGRRYELFSSLEDFTHWKDGAFRSMQLAEPVARRQRVKIGIENHKDFHAAELAELLGRLSSPHIGACVDTGNSIALLEDPMTVVETLAPYAVTTHIKDMAVQEMPTGFLLAEVPLGEGILDLPRMFALFEKYNPDIDYYLEMITRDPLDIPCLKPGYWATFPDKPGAELARTLTMVRERKADKMPKTAGLRLEEALEFEEGNIVKCLRQAGEKYGFTPTLKPRAAGNKDEH
ncbi:TIM barrel protein [Prosthecobacter sp.]|uniref:sugar phosphate isomerase/epimerase family protein n=1 Tax=Prosthecobacter sp. TaxID=1965333 RepID=UPI00248A184F|nr:TIM barrel protein [Prosthecobacter sp.]MDI1314694.1 TIM barrel protein [Prosthecobacter sp.]